MIMWWSTCALEMNKKNHEINNEINFTELLYLHSKMTAKIKIKLSRVSDTNINHSPGGNVVTTTTLHKYRWYFRNIIKGGGRLCCHYVYNMYVSCYARQTPTWSSFLTQNNLVWWRFWTIINVIPGLYPDSNFKQASRTAFNSCDITSTEKQKCFWNVLWKDAHFLTYLIKLSFTDTITIKNNSTWFMICGLIKLNQ